MRLDFPVQQGQGSIAGLEELEKLLKAAVKTSFETRAKAYEKEVMCVSVWHECVWLPSKELVYRAVAVSKPKLWSLVHII